MYLFLFIVVTSCTICLFNDEAFAVAQIQDLIGSLQKCDREGEIFDANISNSKCFNCVCRGGYVRCTKKCQEIDGCHQLRESKKDECRCKKCKGCTRNGLYYESGAEWTESIDPCRLFTCIAGIITAFKMRCYVPCKSSLLPESGHCCRKCLDCRVGNEIIDNRSQVMPAQDPCVFCDCNSGLLSCFKKTCPVLNCPQSKIVQDYMACCPRCTGSNRLMDPPNGACLFLPSGTVYKTGQKFQLDHCTSCKCENSTIHCERESCPVLNCPKSKQKVLPKGCCAYCDYTDDEPEYPPYLDINDVNQMEDQFTSQETVGQICFHKGLVFKDGEIWNSTSCESCVCKNRIAQCTEIKCSIERCLGDRILRVPAGECCPVCTENDGVCTVTKGSHVRTFDGKVYAFIGTCKYQLASDCDRNTFSVRMKNRMSEYEVATKRITLRLGSVKIDLQDNRRTKVNDQIVDLPYELKNIVKIDGNRDKILVEAMIGMRVFWDYDGLLDVKVSSGYKEKMCGLCGDFNSIKNDDLMTREGAMVEEPSIFADSWIMDNETCLETRKYGIRWQPNKDERLLNYIKELILERCLKNMDLASYYETYVKDKCECRQGDLQCHCTAFYLLPKLQLI